MEAQPKQNPNKGLGLVRFWATVVYLSLLVVTIILSVTVSTSLKTITA